ncbi:MAG TPA: hypothetical protein VE912_10290, partial [Bacteroidales bacterium]|nr:hypothetical protein [Bacteroidales bacterium]
SDELAQQDEIERQLGKYESAKEQMGLVGKFQLNKVQRETLVEAAKEEYQAQLKYWKNRVNAQLEVSNAKLDQSLKNELNKIDQQHLKRLKELKISEFEERVSLQEQLLSLTDQLMTRAQNLDLPEKFVEELINNILDEKQKLMNEITKSYDN